MRTSIEEFELWVSLIPEDVLFQAWLFPVARNDKVPDVPAGESWKDEKHRLTVEQARSRILGGSNVGVAATGEGLVFFDFDKPEVLKPESFPDTLTVITRNGRVHKHYLNGGVQNADGKGKYAGCGEIRARWKYVLTPGSYVPPDSAASPDANGFYRIVKPIPPTLLKESDLPNELKPTPASHVVVDLKVPIGMRNKYGWALEDVRNRDRKLDDLLSNLTPAGYPSASEADMATVSKLLFWGYEAAEVVDIWRTYRPRDKLKRDDYIKTTLSKVRVTETIAYHVDIKFWHPGTGYSLKFEDRERDKPLASEPEKVEKETSYDIGDTFLYKGDRKFQGRVQLTALGRPYSRFMKLEMKCTGDKDWCLGCVLKNTQKLDFENQNMDASAFATYFDTNNPVDSLRVLVERSLEPNCAAWKGKTSCSGKRERAITTAVVLDKSATEGRAWFVHGPNCDLKRGPNWVVADGWLCKGSKGKIGILVRGFMTDSEIAPPSDEEIAKSRDVLMRNSHAGDLEGSTVWAIAKVLQRKSQLKGKEVEKGFVSDLLTIGSSTWVKTIEGPKSLGATTSEIGPTTTAKSQRQREVMTWLGTGTYKAGRMTKAGLTAGAEKAEGIGWVVRKGLLPSCDLNYLVLDNMPSYILDSQIESRRNGIIELTAMRGMELWSRARLKLLSNPKNPFDETLYKCTALKTYDRKLIARFTFAVFTYGVTSEERYKSDVEILTEEDMELLDAARTVLRWNMSKEITYDVPLDLWPEIMKTSKELEDKYGCEDIPLLLRSIPHKLGVLMYSFALLEGAEKPDKSHLDLAKEWLEFCAADIELDNYVIQWRDMHTLSNIEYETIREKLEKEIGEDIIRHGGGVIDSSFYRFIEYLAKNEKATRDEVAAYLECTGRTISDKAKFLKGLQLLKSDKDGYSFIGKGVRFVRRWLPSVTGEDLQPSYEEEKKHALIWLSDPKNIKYDEMWASLDELQRFLSTFFEGKLDKGADLSRLMVAEGLVDLHDTKQGFVRRVKEVS